MYSRWGPKSRYGISVSRNDWTEPADWLSMGPVVAEELNQASVPSYPFVFPFSRPVADRPLAP